MNILDLAHQPEPVLMQAAELLVSHFHEPRGWPNITAAREEVATVLQNGFARAVLDAGTLLGWIGGLPELAYQNRVYELHPMVVHGEHRRHGIGRALVEAFETEARLRGALTATLGTDDDSAMTSLSNVNLFLDLPRHIADLHDLGRNHPAFFYQKLGYVVTGVMPDANGPGRPDIYMSKSLRL